MPQTFQHPDLADDETTSTPQEYHNIDPCHSIPTSNHNSVNQSSCSTDLASQLQPGHGGDQVGYLLPPRQGVPDHQEQAQQLLQGLGAGQTLQISSQQVTPGNPGPGGENLVPQTFQLPDLTVGGITSTPQDYHSTDPCHTTPTSNHNSVNQSSCSTDLASQLQPGHGGDQDRYLLSPRKGVPDHQLPGLGAGQRQQISSQQMPGHGVQGEQQPGQAMQGPPVHGHEGQQQVHGQGLAHGQVISKPGTMESTLGSSDMLEIVSWSPDNVICEPRPEATLGSSTDLQPVQQAGSEEPVRESRKRQLSEPDYRFDSFRMKSIIAT